MVKSKKIYKNFNINPRYKNSIILIGNFDGVHKGHQKLFKLAKKYKKKNQDEFKGRILKFLNQFKTMKEEREMTASELASQASNDADLYRRQIQPIIKNLGRKKYKGIFNRDLAIKLFRYAVDNKVKEIAQQKNMSSRMIPGAVRNDAASQMLSSFSSEIDEFAQELKKKSA